MNKYYNWWEDPNNKEEVDKLSWWNHSENKTFIEFPVSIIQDGKYWVIGTNDDTYKLMGDNFNSSAQGDTKEEAIQQFFLGLHIILDYSEKCRLNYQRWVPFRKGPWRKIGGTWFAIFGFHVYFRYGKGMKGGWYIPFTKLNISFSSDWALYKHYKNEQIRKKANS